MNIILDFQLGFLLRPRSHLKDVWDVCVFISSKLDICPRDVREPSATWVLGHRDIYVDRDISSKALTFTGHSLSNAFGPSEMSANIMAKLMSTSVPDISNDGLKCDLSVTLDYICKLSHY